MMKIENRFRMFHSSEIGFCVCKNDNATCKKMDYILASCQLLIIADVHSKFQRMPIIPMTIPAVDTPVGRVPSFLLLETIPKITPKIDGTKVQHATIPTMLKINEAMA